MRESKMEGGSAGARVNMMVRGEYLFDGGKERIS